jgi:hypothetical protein
MCIVPLILISIFALLACVSLIFISSAWLLLSGSRSKVGSYMWRGVISIWRGDIPWLYVSWHSHFLSVLLFS